MKLISLLFIVLCSCELTDQKHIFVDPVLKPYYTSFIQESKDRGLHFEEREILMVFKKMDVCGLTVYSSSTIFIDSTRFCWYEDPTEVVFHELGHLFLMRSHDNSKVNGQVKSIMCSYCYVISKNMTKYHNYYVSELFDPNTKVMPPEPLEKPDTLINPLINPITDSIQKYHR